MLRDVLFWIQEKHPAVARWLGDRVDLQAPAWGVSLAFHVIVIVSLGLVGYATTSDTRPSAFRTEVLNTQLSDFAKLDSVAIADIDNTQMTPVVGSFGAKTEALLVQPPPVDKAPQPMPEIKNPGVAKIASVSLPAPTHLDRNVSIQGTGAEHVGSVEGAVDRIAVEILRKMETGRTLVIWAFDASGSLLRERERLTKYIDGVYEHVLQLDKDQLVQNDGLLTAVVGFGKDRKILCEPTADRTVVSSAIASVPLDTTGREFTFQTTSFIAKKYGHFQKDKQPFKTMLIIVTDEMGDDDDHLEEAIYNANSVKMPVFVLGSPALFGRSDNYVDYNDPVTKQFYRGLKVDQGAESVLLEGIQVPFWYDGPQYDFMDAGFGPYALSRLAGATNGIYFVTRMGNTRITFDPAGMREYKPDWMSKEQYLLALNKHPLRRAVIRASLITQERKFRGQPGLSYPAADGPEFKEAMGRNQEVVAQIQYLVDEALGVTGAGPNEPTILNMVKRRDHETSRRWQAHYDLIRGRLLAMRIRCMEYNMACAKMKKDAPKFTKPESNAWRMVPDTEVHLKGRDLQDADEAKQLLEQVVRDHPGTPWALLAKRELKDPFGFKWVEVKLPPPPRRNDNPGAPKMKNQRANPPAKPPELPKL